MKLKRNVKLVVLAAGLFAGGVFMVASTTMRQQAVLGDSTSSPSARNEQRKANLESIRLALIAYRDAHKNVLPVSFPAAQTPICTGLSANCKAVKFVDLNFLVNSGYLDSIPNDPTGRKGRFTSGYTIYREKNGSLILTAPNTEGSDPLSVKL